MINNHWTNTFRSELITIAMNFAVRILLIERIRSDLELEQKRSNEAKVSIIFAWNVKLNKKKFCILQPIDYLSNKLESNVISVLDINNKYR
jgi:hypothetical protein